MKKKLLLTALTFGLGLYSASSSAQIFKLRITDYGAAAGNTPFESFINTEILKIESEINKELPSAPPQRLMEGMANSSVMAGKGIGSDYASNMSVLLIGAGVGVGADLEKDEATDSDLSGVGVAPGLVVGANLGFMDTKSILGMDTNRLSLYVNFMKFSKEQDLEDEPGKESSAEIDTLNLGVHLRYDWIKGKGNSFLGWGGVKLHTGWEYNKTSLQFNSKISEAVPSSTGPGGEIISGTITGAPNATIDVATHSIPFEISTDVQLLYVLSLYTGLGADLSFGQAEGGGSLNSGNSPITCTGGACGGGGTTVQVKPEANIDATGKVDSLLFRGFAGVQFNIPFVRVFVQVDKSLGNDLIGATAGLRFVY
ncbi:MAG TPA: hypothetical protein VNJ08_00950 [Bacteriovoracaceae bacterium]|nr:hypothetical protein [Bacteriovoracaceae bacterium]